MTNMNNVLEAVASANEAGVAALTSVQERVLDFHREVAATLTKPEVPSWVPTADPSLAADVVEQAFSLGAKIAEANKGFALGVIQAWTPAQKPAAKK
jgi:hypothetical protein